MVTKWIAISIIVGLLVAMTPVFIVWLWTISKVFVSAILLIALVVGFIYLVVRAIDKEMEIKRLAKEIEEILEQEENDK